MRFRVTGRIMALIALLALAAAACGDDGGNGAADPEGADTEDEQTDRDTPVPVTIGMAVERDAANLPLLLADEQGIYDDYGLDAEVVFFEGGGALVQAMSAGQTDYGWVAHAPVIRAIEQGADLQIVAEINETAVGWGWVVLPDSPIQSADDLEPGMAISFTSEGALTHWYAIYTAEQGGLSQDEWTGVPLGGAVPAIVSALEQGDIDAATVLIPWGEMMEADGSARFVDRLDEQLPEFSFAGLHATGEALSDRTTAGCVVGAYSEAVQWLRDNPDETIAFMEDFYELEPELAETVYEMLAEDFSDDGQFDEGRLEFVIESLEAPGGFIEGTATVEDVLDQVEPLGQEECA